MDNKIDVTLIMETWITDQDQIWLDCCDFNNMVLILTLPTDRREREEALH